MGNELKPRRLLIVSAMLIAATTGSNATVSIASIQVPHSKPSTLTIKRNYEPTNNDPSPSSADISFLKKIRAAGFTKTQISDEQAIDAAHKIIYWICDDDRPSSRIYVEEFLVNFGIVERRGPRSVSTFAGVALQAYRQTSDPTDC